MRAHTSRNLRVPSATSLAHAPSRRAFFIVSGSSWRVADLRSGHQLEIRPVLRYTRIVSPPELKGLLAGRKSLPSGGCETPLFFTTCLATASSICETAPAWRQSPRSLALASTLGRFLGERPPSRTAAGPCRSGSGAPPGDGKFLRGTLACLHARGGQPRLSRA
jgi:hypothetical protein